MSRTNQIIKSPYLFFAISGLVGGLAEIVWMYVYNINNALGLKEISQQIAMTLQIHSSNYYIGLIIHLSLSILIGVTFGKFITEKFCKNNLVLMLLSAMTILAIIWLVTFKLILPIINPDMANIVPNSISFISKMLFGISMVLSYGLWQPSN